MQTEHFFIDFLNQAELDTPALNHVEIQRVIIKRDSRTALFLHPDSKVTFPVVALHENAILRSAICLKQQVWNKNKGTTHFELGILNEKGKHHILWKHALTPSRKEADRNWIELEVDMRAWKGQNVQFTFTTRAEGSHAYAWAAWADPVLTHEKPKPIPAKQTDKHPHIILITSDALSRRFLGCYGNKEVQTPHIDGLAQESVLFEQACSQSTCTLGAYASMLSGMSPDEHKLYTEWGKFPSGKISLPVALNTRGYHTTLLTSENELNHSSFGFQNLFNSGIHAISNPAQDGAITVRAFERYWKNRPDQPTFSWVQFFDTHPPSLPPKRLRDRYYSGNPERIQDKSELVKRVYGLETLVEMERLLPLLERGEKIPGQPRERFYATARALKGQQENGPDLFEHLNNLGPEARRGMENITFGYWLEKEINAYQNNGKASTEFLTWFKDLIQKLLFIQSDITGWLDGVQDFNYPISQYKACTHYFDQHIGSLIKVLKDTDTYDQTLIILTSPHGEILQFDGVAFHHHIPHSHVFDVPLIVKAPHQKTGKRVMGLTEHRDILPSLMDFLKMDQSQIPQCNGKSWWPSVQTGNHHPRTISKGYDINKILTSLYKPPYLYVESHDKYQLTPNWAGEANESFLFQTIEGEPGMQIMNDTSMTDALLSEYRTSTEKK